MNEKSEIYYAIRHVKMLARSMKTDAKGIASSLGLNSKERNLIVKTLEAIVEDFENKIHINNNEILLDEVAELMEKLEKLELPDEMYVEMGNVLSTFRPKENDTITNELIKNGLNNSKKYLEDMILKYTN